MELEIVKEFGDVKLVYDGKYYGVSTRVGLALFDNAVEAFDTYLGMVLMMDSQERIKGMLAKIYEAAFEFGRAVETDALDRQFLYGYLQGVDQLCGCMGVSAVLATLNYMEGFDAGKRSVSNE